MTDTSLAEYQALPECIRQSYSYEQYLWLSEADKGRLLQSETEPDLYED